MTVDRLSGHPRGVQQAPAQMLTEPRGQAGLIRVGRGPAPRREQKLWFGRGRLRSRWVLRNENAQCRRAGGLQGGQRTGRPSDDHVPAEKGCGRLEWEGLSGM